MKVCELIEKACKTSGVTWVSVRYGSTRTINNAMDREALAYLIGYKSFMVIFRKRDGYLAYRGFIDVWDDHIRTEPMSLKKAVKDLDECRKEGIGIIYTDDAVMDKIIKTAVVDEI